MRKQFAKCYLTQWWSELATEFVQFDTVRLLSLGVCEISCLCQQTTNNSWAQGRDSTCHWRNSRNYAEMSSRISSKEQQCASRVVGDVCRILCSTINRSVCTLYRNKNISTFWINGAFYYKIKSCALVGTPYTISFCVMIRKHNHKNALYPHVLTIVSAMWNRKQRGTTGGRLNVFQKCLHARKYWQLLSPHLHTVTCVWDFILSQPWVLRPWSWSK
jgi:hypothetical protein